MKRKNTLLDKTSMSILIVIDKDDFSAAHKPNLTVYKSIIEAHVFLF